MVQHSVSTAPTPDGLAHSLRHLREVFTRPDFQALARQHARGKLTVQEKIACLFDSGTFVEDMVPSPDLDPWHGERRLLTGHGQMHGRTARFPDWQILCLLCSEQPERHLNGAVQGDGKRRAGLALHVGRYVILEVAQEPHGVRVLGIPCGLTLIRVFIPVRPR